ncbi:hypothetical protein BSKO_06353 [Bryopsis sp. KO-2023]|nr:hypothetical protein BSKO_06353 [Bryopsis sp. KO-2023]
MEDEDQLEFLASELDRVRVMRADITQMQDDLRSARLNLERSQESFEYSHRAFVLESPERRILDDGTNRASLDTNRYWHECHHKLDRDDQGSFHRHSSPTRRERYPADCQVHSARPPGTPERDWSPTRAESPSRGTLVCNRCGSPGLTMFGGEELNRSNSGCAWKDQAWLQNEIAVLRTGIGELQRSVDRAQHTSKIWPKKSSSDQPDDSESNSSDARNKKRHIHVELQKRMDKMCEDVTALSIRLDSVEDPEGMHFPQGKSAQQSGMHKEFMEEMDDLRAHMHSLGGQMKDMAQSWASGDRDSALITLRKKGDAGFDVKGQGVCASSRSASANDGLNGDQTKFILAGEGAVCTSDVERNTRNIHGSNVAEERDSQSLNAGGGNDRHKDVHGEVNLGCVSRHEIWKEDNSGAGSGFGCATGGVGIQDEPNCDKNGKEQNGKARGFKMREEFHEEVPCGEMDRTVKPGGVTGNTEGGRNRVNDRGIYQTDPASRPQESQPVRPGRPGHQNIHHDSTSGEIPPNPQVMGSQSPHTRYCPDGHNFFHSFPGRDDQDTELFKPNRLDTGCEHQTENLEKSPHQLHPFSSLRGAQVRRSGGCLEETEILGGGETHPSTRMENSCATEQGLDSVAAPFNTSVEHSQVGEIGTCEGSGNSNTGDELSFSAIEKQSTEFEFSCRPHDRNIGSTGLTVESALPETANQAAQDTIPNGDAVIWRQSASANTVRSPLAINQPVYRAPTRNANEKEVDSEQHCEKEEVPNVAASVTGKVHGEPILTTDDKRPLCINHDDGAVRNSASSPGKVIEIEEVDRASESGAVRFPLRTTSIAKLNTDPDLHEDFAGSQEIAATQKITSEGPGLLDPATTPPPSILEAVGKSGVVPIGSECCYPGDDDGRACSTSHSAVTRWWAKHKKDDEHSEIDSGCFAESSAHANDPQPQWQRNSNAAPSYTPTGGIGESSGGPDGHAAHEYCLAGGDPEGLSVQSCAEAKDTNIQQMNAAEPWSAVFPYPGDKERSKIDFQNRFGDVRRQLEGLSKGLDEAETNPSIQLKDLSVLRAALRQLIDRVDSACEVSEKEVNLLQNELKNSFDNHSQLKDVCQDLHLKNLELLECKEQEEAKLAISEKEATNLKLRLTEMKSNLSLMSGQLAGATGKLNEKSERLNFLERERSISQETLLTARSDLASKTSQLARCSSALEQASSIIQQRRSSSHGIEVSQERILELSRENMDLRHQISRMDRHGGSSEGGVTEPDSCANSCREVASCDGGEWNEKNSCEDVATLKKQIEGLKETIQSKEAHIEVLEADNEKANKTIASLKLFIQSSGLEGPGAEEPGLHETPDLSRVAAAKPAAQSETCSELADTQNFENSALARRDSSSHDLFLDERLPPSAENGKQGGYLSSVSHQGKKRSLLTVDTNMEAEEAAEFSSQGNCSPTSLFPPDTWVPYNSDLASGADVRSHCSTVSWSQTPMNRQEVGALPRVGDFSSWNNNWDTLSVCSTLSRYPTPPGLDEMLSDLSGYLAKQKTPQDRWKAMFRKVKKIRKQATSKQNTTVNPRIARHMLGAEERTQPRVKKNLEIFFKGFKGPDGGAGTLQEAQKFESGDLSGSCVAQEGRGKLPSFRRSRSNCPEAGREHLEKSRSILEERLAAMDLALAAVKES